MNTKLYKFTYYLYLFILGINLWLFFLYLKNLVPVVLAAGVQVLFDFHILRNIIYTNASLIVAALIVVLLYKIGQINQQEPIRFVKPGLITAILAQNYFSIIFLVLISANYQTYSVIKVLNQLLSYYSFPSMIFQYTSLVLLSLTLKKTNPIITFAALSIATLLFVLQLLGTFTRTFNIS